MPAPYEIVIGAPFTVWLAVVGTAFPDIGEAPAVAWVKVGTNGEKNYHEDGVKISHPQTIEMIRTLGSTGPVKAVRPDEALIIAFTLLDLTMEMYKLALNSNTVTDTAAASGVGGSRSMPILRGFDVAQRAMLVRGPSPYADSMYLDFRIPRVVHTGEPEIVFKKDAPAGLEMKFEAIEDPDYANGRGGEILGQDAAAL
jgi:hypothetical protein